MQNNLILPPHRQSILSRIASIIRGPSALVDVDVQKGLDTQGTPDEKGGIGPVMGTPGDYTSIDVDGKFTEKLNDFFTDAIAANKTFRHLSDVRDVAFWYGEMKRFGNGKADGLISIVTNQIIAKLSEYIEPFYTSSIINRVQFDVGYVDKNFEVKFPPLKPYVEFIKRVNGTKVSSTKFKFLLESAADLKKVRTPPLKDDKYPNERSIEIGKIDIEPHLSLEQIETPGWLSLSSKIKLVSKNLDINGSVLHLRR